MTIRDKDITDGGKGFAGKATVTVNSSALAIELFNCINKGSTVEEVCIYKLASEPGKPQGLLTPIFSYRFLGVVFYAVAMVSSEQQTIFEGNSTNQYIIASFGFDKIFVKQQKVDADGKINITNKGLSNDMGETRSGK